MEILLVILIILVIGLIVGIGLVISKLNKPTAPTEKPESLSLLLQQMNELSRMVDTKLGATQREMTESMKFQSTRSHELIKEITREITEVKKTGEQVMGFTEQLKDLQNILKNPKQRGVLGEYYLETLLKNVMPPGSYQMQYGFPDGSIVDAAVFIKDKIIPIDSKFSLENYNRIAETNDKAEKERLEKVFINDLKNRIAETSKYIQPAQGTMEFAFMFIPHEAIYYDLLINKIGVVTGEDTENLIQRAASKYKVIIVSPTSFLAYLQTVLQGLKAMNIEESAKEIQKRVGELGKHLSAYEDYMQKLGNTLGTSVNHYNKAYKELGKIDKDVTRITGEAVGLEVLQLDKPQEE